METTCSLVEVCRLLGIRLAWGSPVCSGGGPCRGSCQTTALREVPSPCNLGFRWDLEGTEPTAFSLGPWLFWALKKVLPHTTEVLQKSRRWEVPHHLYP